MSTATKIPPYTLTSESVMVVWEGKTHTVSKSSANYAGLRKAIIEEDWASIPNHLTIKNTLDTWLKGDFKRNGDTLMYAGKPLPTNLNDRILKMATAGEDPAPLFHFWERLKKNPSMRSVEQLWGFLQHEGIPITKDGKILAYKGVREDYKDCHSGTIDNKPGTVHKMPRNEISDDPREACHAGFHVGALGHASGYGKRIIVCEIDPEHVVCVPYDVNQQKMRVCEYKVIGNHNDHLLPSTVFHEEEDTDEPEDIEDVSKEDDQEDADDGDDQEEDEEGDDPFKGARQAEEVRKETEGDDEEESAFDAPQKAPPKPKLTTKAPASDFNKYKSLDLDELMIIPLDKLRRYATYGLQIVGASKIPGGKIALVKKILKSRK